MIVGDLFAGVGGMSEGFRQAGFKIAFAVEFDKDIAKAYQLNHKGADLEKKGFAGLGHEYYLVYEFDTSK